MDDDGAAALMNGIRADDTLIDAGHNIINGAEDVSRRVGGVPAAGGDDAEPSQEVRQERVVVSCTRNFSHTHTAYVICNASDTGDDPRLHVSCLISCLPICR